MSVNSSSSSDSQLHPHHSSINSSLPLDIHCLLTRTASFIPIMFSIINVIIFLPLYSFILYHGLQQWQKKRSTSSAETVSHCDSFTYHLVTMEMIGVFGHIIGSCGIYMEDSNMFLMWYSLFSFTWYGQMFFHMLTCVERYLAVVHPITYLSLRGERGIRLRNITIGCVWLLSFVGLGSVMEDFLLIVDYSLWILSLTVVSFCSLSVLCVLIRPGPGEQRWGGGRERADQSKQRAFYTIVSILGVLLLRFAWDLVWLVLFLSKEVSTCVIIPYEIWFYIPSSLVLPLLFLHRAGKLVCCKNNNQTG